MAPATVPRDARLAASVAIGALAGLAYVAFDVLSESRLERGTLTGALAGLHVVVDRGGPVVVGAMLGVFVHYLSLRRELAAAEALASRADALRARLSKVERDQAVWVLAAAVLHELNNPLHALGLLLDEHADETDAARRAELVERARVHADRARSKLAMLRALRASGEPRLGRVELGSVVRALADEVGSLAAEDGVTVRADGDLSIDASADTNYVRTILENLVDNSLAALRSGGGRSITIGLAVERGRAVVRVADDGPPIDEASRRELFDPLRPGLRADGATHGLGLGLPIARALARAMRGDLSLEAAASKAFLLELPLHDPTEERAP